MAGKPGSRFAHLVAIFGAWLLAAAAAGCGSFPPGVPPSGPILNFGQVNATLFRGAQPDAPGIARLQQLGIRTIINLRLPADTWPGEEAAARAGGLEYFSVPLRGLSAPTDAEVERVFALIASSPPPVFVHCEHGADRTGTIIACYRQWHDGWTVERAFADAQSHGFSMFQIGMKHYIHTFPHSSVRRTGQPQATFP